MHMRRLIAFQSLRFVRSLLINRGRADSFVSRTVIFTTLFNVCVANISDLSRTVLGRHHSIRRLSICNGSIPAQPTKFRKSFTVSIDQLVCHDQINFILATQARFRKYLCRLSHKNVTMGELVGLYTDDEKLSGF